MAAVVNYIKKGAIFGTKSSHALSIERITRVRSSEVVKGFRKAVKRLKVLSSKSFETLYQMMSVEGIPSFISQSLMFKRSN